MLLNVTAMGQASPLESHDDPLAAPRNEDTLVQQWLALINVTRQLEALSHKQLRGMDWNPSEANFIRTYGERIAFVMGYFGNSWEIPRDDSLRVAVVGDDPSSGTYQHVGIARAHSLYVLYPWKGQLALRQGAIMPFQVRTLPQRLNDNEWMEYLNQNQARFPDWLQPIVEENARNDK